MTQVNKATLTGGPLEKPYISRIQGLLSSNINRTASAERSVNLVKLLRQTDTSRAKIFYTNSDLKPKVATSSDVVAFSADDRQSKKEGVCVIENISPGCIEKLGSAWDLEPEFFVRHIINPGREDLWARHFDEYEVRRYQHLDGNSEYHGLRGQKALDSMPNYFPRYCYQESSNPVQSNTRISYYRVSEILYLFLVDTPLDIMTKHVDLYPNIRPTLRLMYATNRGGLILPPLFPQTKYSLFDSLMGFFQHGWHFRVLFDNDEFAIPGQPLLYILASSVWESNLRYLTREIHRISFEEIRNPSLNINNALHARRENLAFMKSSLTETNKFVPVKVVEYFKEHIYFVRNAQSQWKPVTPIEIHQRTLDEAAQLDGFLMETFQLLMSSISVRDSQLSIEQSQRATRLTQLAFIYAPLSFVAGIFGMNVREINATGLSIWVFFVTLAITSILTAGLFWIIRTLGNNRKEGAKSTQV